MINRPRQQARAAQPPVGVSTAASQSWRARDGAERGRPRLPPRAGASARPADPGIGRQEGNGNSLCSHHPMFFDRYACVQCQVVVEPISDLHWFFFLSFLLCAPAALRDLLPGLPGQPFCSALNDHQRVRSRFSVLHWCPFC